MSIGLSAHLFGRLSSWVSFHCGVCVCDIPMRHTCFVYVCVCLCGLCLTCLVRLLCFIKCGLRMFYWRLCSVKSCRCYRPLSCLVVVLALLLLRLVVALMMVMLLVSVAVVVVGGGWWCFSRFPFLSTAVMFSSLCCCCCLWPLLFLSLLLVMVTTCSYIQLYVLI